MTESGTNERAAGKGGVNRDKTSLRVNTGANQEQEKLRTNWLAWSLQLALGLVVGFGASFTTARLLFRSGFLNFDGMFLVVTGGALCCGAFASYHGDRAWMSSSIFDSPRPPRNQPSRKWSIIIGSFGGLLVFGTIGVHLITAGWPSGRSSSGAFSILPLLFAAIPGFFLIHALRTGTGFWRFGILDREETPLFFWIYVFGMAFGVVCILFGR